MSYQVKRRFLALTCFTCLLLISSQPSWGQRSSGYRQNAKNHSDIKKVYSELTEPLGKSTVLIYFNESNIALGTVVDAAGLIVTKASEIKDKEIMCVIDGDELAPTILATDESMDLALLKVDAKDLTPVTFASQETQIDSGQIVVSVDYDAEPASIGMITVKPRLFRTGARSRRNPRKQGFLGVQTDDNPDGDGVVIINVTARTGASRARLHARDIILEVSGDKTNTREELSRAIKKHKPGAEITIKYLRKDQELSVKAKLGDMADANNGVYDQWGGGPFSKRRFNFPMVIAHDSILKPNKMGGPLLNSDGKVIGINIARALRVSTYAIPANDVKNFVNKNKSSRPTSNDKTNK